MLNITFDLETLGNKYDAPIVQIAAVKFTNEGKILSAFNKHVKLSSLEKYGFSVTYSTIRWWFGQSMRAIRAVFKNRHTVSIDVAIKDFKAWIGENPGDYAYWSHASFDPPILANTIRELKMDDWIPYGKHRDIRTLLHFIGGIPNDIEKAGIAHNAIDDCKFQAAYICRAIEMLKEKGVAV